MSRSDVTHHYASRSRIVLPEIHPDTCPQCGAACVSANLDWGVTIFSGCQHPYFLIPTDVLVADEHAAEDAIREEARLSDIGDARREAKFGKSL